MSQESQTKPRPTVAIIGAGLSGMQAARILQDHGYSIVVFEKSRGVGGRMATRRVDGQPRFDHGAQYFTVRGPQFAEHVEKWKALGVVKRWTDKDSGKIVVINDGKVQRESASVTRYVATPTMNAICKHLSEDIEIKKQTRIANINKKPTGVQLTSDAGIDLGTFDRIIVSVPAGQAAELLKDIPVLAEPIAQLKMNPCWALMASFANRLTDQWNGAFLHNSFLSWVACDSSKPDRSDDSAHYVIHAQPDWTNQHWQDEPDAIAAMMLNELFRVTSINPVPATHLVAHRWTFSIALKPSTAGCFFDQTSGIVACGDWACGSRVEGAFLSGVAAANKIVASLAE